ncbi:hypothetical protein I552_7936 [Mycobacterium xenopi 3993]|nr:hypothetical protein I552_7936 [Mycobacterium xenopi 3993]
MSRSTRGTLLAVLGTAGLAAVLALGPAGPGRPDQPPGDPTVADPGPVTHRRHRRRSCRQRRQQAIRWQHRLPRTLRPAVGTDRLRCSTRGTSRWPGPDAVRRRAAVPAAVVQPGQRRDGRRGQADYHQFPATDRRPGDGGKGDPYFVGATGARQVLLDEPNPGAVASTELLAGPHHREYRCSRHQVQLSDG